MADRTDNELMAATGRGDLRSLGLLFERHHARVHALCYRLTGDPSAADDLVQESFLRVLKYAKGFEARASFTTWLYRLVTNVCRNHMNTAAKDRDRTEAIAQELRVEQGGNPDNESDPRLDAIRRALYRLPPDKREVLVLSRYQGLSYAEIARICQTTVGAIKARAHRAVRELRRELEELEQTP